MTCYSELVRALSHAWRRSIDIGIHRGHLSCLCARDGEPWRDNIKGRCRQPKADIFPHVNDTRRVMSITVRCYGFYL